VSDGTADVLMFVEDPGAASYVAPLPDALRARGRTSAVLAAGRATSTLREAGVAARVLDGHARAADLLQGARPRLVLVGTAANPDTLGLALVAAARGARIQSVGVVDAAMNAERRFRGRGEHALAYAPDWLLVADDWTRAAYVSLGFPKERVVACGHPNDDRLLAERAALEREGRAAVRRRVLPGAPPDRPIVVFAAEGAAAVERLGVPFSAAGSAFTGRGAPAGRTELVLEELLEALAALAPRPYVVLRRHPKDGADDYAAYRHEVDLVHGGGSALALVYAADLVVGATSRLLDEAARLGRPTLAIVPRAAEREWLASVRSGVTPAPATRQEVRERLRALLLDAAGRETPPVTPGSAVEQVVAFLDGLLARGNRG